VITHLRIQNYAIIRSLHIELNNHLTAITGETGAGKSIVMGALGLILGERADSSVLWNKKEKCVVEGTFHIAPYQLKSFFTAHDLDYDEETIIRREISETGKSRAFINDTPVTLALVKELGEKLVDVHSQHQTLELNNREFQLEVLDVFSKITAEVARYRESYARYRQLQQELQQLEQQEAEANRDRDFKQFLLNELQEAQLQPGEQERTETELTALNHAEDIQTALHTGVQLLRETDTAAISQLQEVRAQWQRVARFNPRITELFNRLDSALIELKDIAAEAEDIAQDSTADKQRQEYLSTRLDLIYSLQKKHRCQTVDELLQLHTQLSAALEHMDSLEGRMAALRTQTEALREELLEAAAQLTAKRKKHIPALEKNIQQLLQQVGMPAAAIQMQLEVLPQEKLNSNGLDEVTLLFASNTGSAFQPLQKIASGGELSRLMLCIKTVVAGLTKLPTLIFDEIDTGISGETARQVGVVMKQLAQKHQVICITHLPQIAACAKHHYLVYKESDSQTTQSNMRLLQPEERIEEIAKMLSGAQPTEGARANARELVG
jgi:DNA repair protein RecN (Recombination protein N)